MESILSANGDLAGNLGEKFALLASPAYPSVALECAHLAQWFRSQRKATDRLSGLRCALAPEEDRLRTEPNNIRTHCVHDGSMMPPRCFHGTSEYISILPR